MFTQFNSELPVTVAFTPSHKLNVSVNARGICLRVFMLISLLIIIAHSPGVLAFDVCSDAVDYNEEKPLHT